MGRPRRGARPLGFVEADRWTVEATGYVGYLGDDEYFRRLYVDSSLANWQTDQSTKYADRFSVGIEDNDKLVMRVSCYGGDPVQVLHDGMNCRAYWQLFDGITTTQQISAFKFGYQANNFADSLRCRLYGRDKLSGGSVNTLLWTSPASYEPSGDVSLDAEDIGDDVKVLVFKLDQVGEVITQYTDTSGTSVDAWALFCGIAFDDLRVYASSLGANVTPERVVRDAVLTLVDDDHIDFPDTSSYALEHVDFSDPTTVQQAIEDMNAMLDWDYGFDDGQTFFFRKPWTAATVPAGELISIKRYYSISQNNTQSEEVVIIQPNIDPYEDKFRIPFIIQLNKVLSMAEEAVTPETKWIITPETTVDDPLDLSQLNDNEYITTIQKFVVKNQSASIVTGMVTYKKYPFAENAPSTSAVIKDSTGNYYDHFNSALKIDTGQVIEIYHKSKLVPGIEMQFDYNPAKSIPEDTS